MTVDGDTITGQAVPFGKMVQLGPTLFEQFEAGAFHRQLKDPARVKLCLEHGQVIGKCEQLTETDDGLRFTARISDHPGLPEAARARAYVDGQLMDELSIGFTAVQGGTTTTVRDDGSTLMSHRRARLLEVSLVPWGVYGRDATLRSLARLVDPAQAEAAARRAKDRAWLSEWARKV